MGATRETFFPAYIARLLKLPGWLFHRLLFEVLSLDMRSWQHALQLITGRHLCVPTEGHPSPAHPFNAPWRLHATFLSLPCPCPVVGLPTLTLKEQPAASSPKRLTSGHV